MERGMKMVKHFVTNEKGATAIEYGLIASLIVIAMMTGLSALGSGAGSMWNTVQNEVTTATE
jgi:pilus assembly protein Flp/PilA